MINIVRRFRGDLSLESNRFYKLSDSLKQSVFSCKLDFIPFVLAVSPDFDADKIVGSVFILDESSKLYKSKYNGWEHWRIFDKDSFKFITGWSYRPTRDESDVIASIWLLNTCLDFERI